MIYDGNLRDQKVAQKPGLKERVLNYHLKTRNRHLWFQTASNSINSTTQNLHTEGLNDEDWNNLFCARDEKEEEYISADESSDSDST